MSCDSIVLCVLSLSETYRVRRRSIFVKVTKHREAIDSSYKRFFLSYFFESHPPGCILIWILGHVFSARFQPFFFFSGFWDTLFFFFSAFFFFFFRGTWRFF